MTMMRIPTSIAVLLAALPASIPAQAPPRSAGDPCFLARPAPDCSVFFLTNAGGYLPGRAIVDWGVMLNTGQRTAIGGSWYLTLDEDDLSTGPVVRYRRWLDQNRSLDLAVGTPIASGQGLKTGSLLAVIKYNPVHWFGIGLRPEYVRRQTSECDSFGCTEQTESSGRVYEGAELGWYAGLTLSFAGGVALGVAVIVFAASGSS